MPFRQWAQSPGFVRRYSAAMLDLLLPQQCPLCRRFCFDNGLCAECWRELVFITPPLCGCCGRPLGYAIGDHPCGACLQAAPPLTEIRSCFVYNDQSRKLILKFKHGDALHLTPLFSRFLKMHFTTLAQANHLVVPIPLHARRYWHRRYNQAAEMARMLCWHHDQDAFCPDILKRPKSGSSQAGLSRHQRQRNLAGAFSVPAAKRDRLAGQLVLLIDDVMTTGATLYEAARTLRRAGAGQIRALVLARVLRDSL